MPRPGRSSFRGSFSRSARRKTAWGVGPRGRTAGITAAGNTLFATAAAVVLEAITLVRTRGELTVVGTVATALDDGFAEVAAGICIVTENAIGIGVTAVPDPIADRTWDGWLWYWNGGMIADSTAVSVGNGGNKVITIDSKAMRKLRSTDRLIGLVATGSLNGAATIVATLNTRMLFKLP